METAELVDLIGQLDDNIDDLEEALGPLLQKALSDTAGKLPLLDKAHLYVLVTYAIESILFSYLRLNGVKAKEHPIFRELSRVKQYFEKIKVPDSARVPPNTKLDKAAAGRIIKHVLADNKERDAHLAQQHYSNKTANHIRFEDVVNKPNDHAREDAGSRPKARSDRSASVLSDDAPPAQPMVTASNVDPKGSIESNHKRKNRSEDKEAGSDSMIQEAESKKKRKKRKKLREEQKALK